MSTPGVVSFQPARSGRATPVDRTAPHRVPSREPGRVHEVELAHVHPRQPPPVSVHLRLRLAPEDRLPALAARPTLPRLPALPASVVVRRSVPGHAEVSVSPHRWSSLPPTPRARPTASTRRTRATSGTSRAARPRPVPPPRYGGCPHPVRAGSPRPSRSADSSRCAGFVRRGASHSGSSRSAPAPTAARPGRGRRGPRRTRRAQQRTGPPLVGGGPALLGCDAWTRSVLDLLARLRVTPGAAVLHDRAGLPGDQVVMVADAGASGLLDQPRGRVADRVDPDATRGHRGVGPAEEEVPARRAQGRVHGHLSHARTAARFPRLRLLWTSRTVHVPPMSMRAEPCSSATRRSA